MKCKRIYKCRLCNLVFEAKLAFEYQKENPHTSIPHEHICDEGTISLGDYVGYKKYSNIEKVK